MKFENKTILITGASSGIGKQLAKQLAIENCRLVISARRENLLEELNQTLTQYNNQIFSVKCDVADKNDVAETHQKILDRFGIIDIAILNAGVAIQEDVLNFNSQNAEKTFGANFFGMVYWIEKLLPEFLSRKDGCIVGVSSLADNRGYSKSGSYCASKAAASIYLEGLRLELKKYGIKVITVKPGFVKSEMTDANKFYMPFLMETDEAAKVIINGIKKEKRIIQFPWQTILLSKLVGMVPGKIYDLIGEKYQ